MLNKHHNKSYLRLRVDITKMISIHSVTSQCVRIMLLGCLVFKSMKICLCAQMEILSCKDPKVLNVDDLNLDTSYFDDKDAAFPVWMTQDKVFVAWERQLTNGFSL